MPYRRSTRYRPAPGILPGAVLLTLLAGCVSSPDSTPSPLIQHPLAANYGSSIASGPSTSADSGTVRIVAIAADGTPAAGARVELGSWDGPVQSFRDSTRSGVMLPGVGDSRFHVMANAIADGRGRASFTALEKKQTFAARAFPRDGRPGAYFYSLFWLYTSPTMELKIRLPR